MRVLTVLLTLLICGGAIGLAQPQNVRLLGQVTDADGAVIPRADVLVRWDSTELLTKTNLGIRQNITLKTDDSGTFSIDLPPGFYDVVILSNLFSPEARKVRLKKGEETGLGFVRLYVGMKVDPLVAAEAKPVVVESRPK